MDAELTRILDRYQAETTKSRQRAKEIASAVEAELARARKTLSTGDFAATNAHLQHGLSKMLDAAPPPCDNPIIAAIITGKTQECQRAGITLNAHARVARDLSLPDTDVAAIIFNLIDNALHECEALLAEGAIGNPTITTRMTMLSGQLLIEVENPYRTDKATAHRLQRHPSLQMGPHGLGTGIVSSLAQQHGGIAEFDVRDGQFVVKVMLPLEQDSGV